MSYKTSREAWARNRIPLEPTEARIRELEADAERWAALAGANLPQLQARIRELEVDKLHDDRRIKELKAERDLMMDSAKQLKDRIAKAKAILEGYGHIDTDDRRIARALEALEGK